MVKTRTHTRTRTQFSAVQMSLNDRGQVCLVHLFYVIMLMLLISAILVGLTSGVKFLLNNG